MFASNRSLDHYAVIFEKESRKSPSSAGGIINLRAKEIGNIVGQISFHPPVSNN
jgi:hypothetical protein